MKVQGSEGASRAQAVVSPPSVCLIRHLTAPSGRAPGIHATSGKARDRTLTQAAWAHAGGEGQACPANPIQAGGLLRCHYVTVTHRRHFLEKQSTLKSHNEKKWPAAAPIP